MERKAQNLNSYYKNLKGKIKFIRRIAKKCDLCSTTVRNWVSGDNKPSKKEYVDILVEETGIPEADLFNRDLDETC